ncbi:hypothetical protein DFH09DRAFT_1128162 [Mycena vulgaris]|nr:hypothetical protein DFH09DRAFT_1128162 [Mycena vulgaris]
MRKVRSTGQTDSRHKPSEKNRDGEALYTRPCPLLRPLIPLQMSSTANRPRMIAVHKAPATLSREAFETKYRALANAFTALPVVKEHALKYEVCFANDKFDEQLEAIHLPASASGDVTVIAICETENQENLMKIMTDPEFRKVMESADFLDRTVGGTFTVDRLELINQG